MKHTDGVSLVLLELSNLGCLVWRQEVGLFYDRRGTPRKIGREGQSDILGFCPDGVGLSVEVKVGRDTVKPHQCDWANAVRARNARYSVIRPDRDGWQADILALVHP